MDSLQPPIKPPRGVKNLKETSGLLMAVIRTLANSDSNEQREQVRMKLEKDYRESNQHLQHLVSTDHDYLTQVMNLFGRLSNLITNVRQKVHIVKEKLVESKKLLTCREELKKLWFESREYKYTLQFLREIEQMKEVPSQLVNCFSKKDYLQATHLLMTNINISETTFKDVVGLQELKSELQQKKQELYTKLIDEMKEQIYVHLTQEIVVLRRQGSARGSTDHRSPATIHRTERKISKQSNFRSRRMLDVPGNIKETKIQKNGTIEHSDDLEYVVNNLIECVILLDKVPEFLEELKQSAQKELKSLAMRTTTELLSIDSPTILLEFLQIIMDQFKRVIETHKFIIETFKKKHRSSCVYDLKEIWLKMETVLQQILSEYLDVDNVKKVEQATTESSNIGPSEQYDINIFFSRKKQQRPVKGLLFKFANSVQNDSNVFNTQSTQREEAKKEKQLLCKPSPSYIMQIFVPLCRFAEEIERMVNDSQLEQPSKLSTFLNDFVGKVFLGKRYEEIVSAVDAEKNGMLTPQPKELNGAIHNSPSPLLSALTTSVICTHVQ